MERGVPGRGWGVSLPFGSAGSFVFYGSVFFAALLLFALFRGCKRTQGAGYVGLKLNRLGLHALTQRSHGHRNRQFEGTYAEKDNLRCV